MQADIGENINHGEGEGREGNTEREEDVVVGDSGVGSSEREEIEIEFVCVFLKGRKKRR